MSGETLNTSIALDAAGLSLDECDDLAKAARRAGQAYFHRRGYTFEVVPIAGPGISSAVTLAEDHEAASPWQFPQPDGTLLSVACVLWTPDALSPVLDSAVVDGRLDTTTTVEQIDGCRMLKSVERTVSRERAHPLAASLFGCGKPWSLAAIEPPTPDTKPEPPPAFRREEIRSAVAATGDDFRLRPLGRRVPDAEPAPSTESVLPLQPRLDPIDLSAPHSYGQFVPTRAENYVIMTDDACQVAATVYAYGDLSFGTPQRTAMHAVARILDALTGLSDAQLDKVAGAVRAAVKDIKEGTSAAERRAEEAVRWSHSFPAAYQSRLFGQWPGASVLADECDRAARADGPLDVPVQDQNAENRYAWRDAVLRIIGERPRAFCDELRGIFAPSLAEQMKRSMEMYEDYDPYKLEPAFGLHRPPMEVSLLTPEAPRQRTIPLPPASAADAQPAPGERAGSAHAVALNVAVTPPAAEGEITTPEAALRLLDQLRAQGRERG